MAILDTQHQQHTPIYVELSSVSGSYEALCPPTGKNAQISLHAFDFPILSS
jgi:hypothetical protein